MTSLEIGAIVATFAAGVICGIGSTGILPTPALGILGIVLVWLGATIVSLCVVAGRADRESE